MGHFVLSPREREKRDRRDSRGDEREEWGWLGEAKVLCILLHRGVQLISAYSWARPAILAAGKAREGMFLFLLFLHFHSFSFLTCPSPIIFSTMSLLSLFLCETTQNDPQGLTCC